MSGARSDAVGGGVQSVDRALIVLEILARLGEAGVTEIASELDVHKSTASRLLSSLEDRDLVEQLQDRGKYRLGVGILRLANAVSGELDVVQQGRDICERLAADVGETVNVAVRRSRYVVNVDQARGPSAVGTHNWVGELTPLHATSSGKVLLASMPARVRRELLGTAPLTRFTDRTITSVDELERQLDAVSDDDWVLSVGEFEAGLNAVAAPIRDHGGVAIAALSVSGPVYRLDEARMQEIGPKIASSAAAIGRRMGHLG
jgi:DNA-binding IclR family transcriptional regulator